MEKINDKPKKVLPIRRARCKAPNDDVSNQRRQDLIDLIMKTNSIRCAAKQLGINNSTAKSIYYKFK